MVCQFQNDLRLSCQFNLEATPIKKNEKHLLKRPSKLSFIGIDACFVRLFVRLFVHTRCFYHHEFKIKSFYEFKCLNKLFQVILDIISS